MKFVKTKMLAIAMLLSVAAVNADVTTGGVSVFMPVANGGTAVSNLGWSGSVYQHDSDELRACFKVQMEYGQNAKHKDIGKYLTPSATDTFTVGTANITGTGTYDMAGINLLLQDAFVSGNVTFKPVAKDLVIDFGMYADLSEWLDGLYFHSHLPLQHASWEVEVTEAATVTAAAAFVAGDIDDTGVTVANSPYTSVKSAFKGDKTAGNSTVWSYGRIDGKQTETKVGDITMTLGYNFINKEHYHLGLGVQALLGAGGKTKAAYMFEPIIGYAGRYGVGGELAGGCRLWDKDEDHQLTANMNISAVHLFDNDQVRSYDIENCGAYSRYLLVKKFATLTTVTDTTGSLNSMINVGSLKAKIGMDVAYNGNVAFCWQMGNVAVDFGYQLAGHSKEEHKSWVTNIATDTYGLYSLDTADFGTAPIINEVEQKVTITGDLTGSTEGVPAGAGDALFLKSSRLNKASGLMKAAVEHCVFAGLNYNWADNEWAPGVGLLGSYHISGSDNNSFDRWTVGFQFNFCV
jgi:hypothetical protein